MDSITLDVTGLEPAQVSSLYAFALELRGLSEDAVHGGPAAPKGSADDEEAHERAVERHLRDQEQRMEWEERDAARHSLSIGRRDVKMTTRQIEAFEILRGVINHGRGRDLDWTRLLAGMIMSEDHRRSRDDARLDVTLNPALARDALRGLKQAFEREAAQHNWTEPIYLPHYDDAFSGLAAIELSAEFCDTLEPVILVSENPW